MNEGFLPGPPFEVRVRYRLAALINGVIRFVAAITIRPLEWLSLWIVPATVHCPSCWRWQRVSKDGTRTVKHKKNCEYMRLVRNERAWQKPDGTPDYP